VGTWLMLGNMKNGLLKTNNKNANIDNANISVSKCDINYNIIYLISNVLKLLLWEIKYEITYEIN
jgi:hypothetical protein